MSTLVPPDASGTLSGRHALFRRIARQGGKSARALVSRAAILHAPSWTPGKKTTTAPGRPNALTWRKSTRSGGNGNECVEVACDGQHVLVRDSKNRTGGTLTCLPRDWGAFLDKLKAGDI